MSLADSFRKINYGKGIADSAINLSTFLKQKDDERRTEEFLKKAIEEQQKVSSFYNPQIVPGQATYPKSQLTDKLKGISQGSYIPSAMQSDLNTGALPNLTQEQAPRPTLGTNQEPKKVFSLRDLGQQPTFVDKEVPADINVANRQANDRINQVVMEGLANKVDPNTINSISQLLQRSVQNRQPVKPELLTLGEGGMIIARDPNTGELTKKIENTKDFNAKPVIDKEIHSFTGSDGQPYTVFQKADNTTYAINALTGKPAPEGVKVKDNDSGVSTALQSLIYRMQQDAEEKKQKERDKQKKYNAEMGLPYLTIDELKQRGAIDDKYGTVDYSNYGGGYYDAKNKKVYFTEDEVANNAARVVPDAPDQWVRSKKNQKTNTKTGTNPDNDPLKLRD